jgi:hypothetical protein
VSRTTRYLPSAIGLLLVASLACTLMLAGAAVAATRSFAPVRQQHGTRKTWTREEAIALGRELVPAVATEVSRTVPLLRTMN